ncbi:cilia- and flagella-associated protein 91-like isoform X2 [Mizuhopecten yessoensis]|uniref:Cilia- and flagella-associated protein 91 n=1 Tax=Mizuhopecten yessoensis TaxID=6573 RepID=A0A210PYU3_MIZYE|nr:cilia- and flagella-associated protein 91-like isoform X2 [Mizuhopecten yessoensis]OWF41651.1 Protein MAATS1 [Mizuhopecten yessoensis]
MATQTQTIKRQAARTHDYLYDNHFVVSSERDHARATFKAHTGTDRVKRVPNYTTMFSELRHHPRFQMRLDVTDPVPKFISRQWRGYGEQQRDAMVRYTTFNYDPSVVVPSKHFANAEVGGKNRYKFFKRPMIPFLQQIPPEVMLATARQDPLAGPDQLLVERPPTPLTRTVEVQTDYRDSEAQTDPYTPEYVVRPGSAPELLTLATLSFGRGLPAGLAEVEMIERARAKRAWEATLPPLNDVSQLDKRRRMMDEMERKEWALREQEIEKLQEARLEVLKDLLKKREENHQELNIKRLDKIWSKKQKEKESKIKKIRNEHIKTIRKLTGKRKQVEGKLERRDVIQDFSNYGSQTYAPLTRIGMFLDRGSEQYVVRSRHINTYQGLIELEQSLPDFVLNPRIKAPKPKTVTKAGFIKRKYRKQRELMDMHESLKAEKAKGEEEPKPLRFLQKIEKPIPRPPTPAVEVPPEEEEEKELAIIYLQKVIRGRAIQNMIFEGKEKRTELIKELRSTHALQDAEQSLKHQEKQATLALQRQRRLHEHKEFLVDESMSQLEGSSMGDTYDFLSKELIRLQEERRIHAFSMLAERQRRIREAEESGRRQVEERRRREEDEVFKQAVKVHQISVDTYLEDIILGSIDKTADIQARSEISEKATMINDLAYEMEDKRTELQSSEIVADLVHCFLIPEVQKQDMREKVRRDQRRYLVAAHKQIVKDGDEIIDMNAKPPKTAPNTANVVQTPSQEEQK